MTMLTEIAEELGKDLEKLRYAGKTVTVKFKAGLQHGLGVLLTCFVVTHVRE